MTWPETVTNDEMQKRFKGGPRLSPNAVLVLLGSPEGGRMYKREGGNWRLLEHLPRPKAWVPGYGS